MNRIRFVEKSSLLLSATLALASCSAPSKGTSVTPAARSPASVVAKFGLECASDAPLFESFSSVDPAPEAADSALTASLEKLSGEARAIATARALAEAFTYGQALVEAYDRLLDRGYSLERIRLLSSTYSELHALYFLKHDLERYATRQLAEAVLARLESEPEGGGPGRGVALLREAAGSNLARWKSYIMAANGDPAYGTLALEAVERAVLQSNGEAKDCTSERGRFGTDLTNALVDHGNQVMLTARSLVRNATAYLAFRPKAGESGTGVVDTVRARAKEIRREWQTVATRSPQSAPPGPVIYPSSGKAGNMFGANFPKGTWALTFDDGPHGGGSAAPSYTAQVLANLKRHDVKATFFILAQHISTRDCAGIGPRVVTVRDKNGNVINERRVNIRGSRPGAVYPELARAARDQGHAMASHSYYHSEVPKGNDAEQNCEIFHSLGVLEEKLGTRPDFFRLPYGSGVSLPGVRAKIAASKLVHVYWNVDTLDWQDRDPDSIYRRTLKAMAASGRGIILFHDVHPQSVIASEKIMAYLKDPANALEAVTIPDVVTRLNGGKAGRQSGDAPFGAK